MSKELSIIIVNYNTFQLTSACIESIYQHTCDVDYEIILVDNASPECPPDLFKKKFPEIHLIKSQENLGFARGNNLGLQQASGEYILLLNSDTELVQNTLYECLQKIKSDPRLGVLSAGLMYPDGTLQAAAQRFPSLRIELVELFRWHYFMSRARRADYFLGFYFDHQSEKEVDWVWGTFFLTSRAVITQLPDAKLPDTFFMYYEDVQWCYLIRKMGYKVLYYPQSKVIHHLSASLSASVKTDREFRKLLNTTRHEIIFLKSTRGTGYVYLLYLIRMLKYLSLRHKRFREIAHFYGKVIWNRLKV